MKRIKGGSEYTSNSIELSILAQDLYDKSLFEECIEKAQKAIRLSRQNYKAFKILFLTYCRIGDQLKAIQQLKQMIILSPLEPNLYRNLGYLLQIQGNVEDAENALLIALSIDPFHANSHYTLSKQFDYEKNKGLWECLDGIDPAQYNTLLERIQVCFAKATIFHRANQYAKSAQWLKKGNENKRLANSSNLEKTILAGKIRYKLSKELKKNKRPARKIGSENIFIVGMPRSGSTLLSSILSMNPNTDDLGECLVFEDTLMAWLQESKSINNLEQLAINYLQSLSTQSDKEFKLDKSLYNFLNIGIIINCMPKARFIHIRRHPLDNALSIYRANFAEGSTYASSLEDIAHMLNLERILTTEYKKQYPHAFFTVDYERLTKDPESQMKSLLSWLNWEWDVNYLNHSKKKRTVETASVIQVRESVHKRSVGGWKNYSELLRPMAKILHKGMAMGSLFCCS